MDCCVWHRWRRMPAAYVQQGCVWTSLVPVSWAGDNRRWLLAVPVPSQPPWVLFPYSEVRTPGYQHPCAGPRVHGSACVTWGGGVTPAAAGPTLCPLAASASAAAHVQPPPAPSPDGATPRSPREHGGLRAAKLTLPSSSTGLLAGEAEPSRGRPPQPRPAPQGARLATSSRCWPCPRRPLPRVAAALRGRACSARRHRQCAGP